MKKSIIIFGFIFLSMLLTFNSAIASGKKLSGKILLQVESGGQAWYVNPANYKRYFMGKPNDAYIVMRELGVGISNQNIEKIPVGISVSPRLDSDSDGLGDAIETALGLDKNSADTDSDSFDDKGELLSGFNPNGNGKLPLDNNFAANQAGKILLQVEQNGEAWYVNPNDNKRYFLGKPSDAYKIMEKFGLGITNSDLETIDKNSDNAMQADIVADKVDIPDNNMEIVKEKILSYINNNLLSNQNNVASIKSMTEIDNLYKYVIDLGTDQEITSYSTRDGSLFFAQAINIDEELKNPKEVDTKKTTSDVSDVEKSTKPIVELFVMSHCPYGTQMEKAMLPVAKLLDDKIDFEIKFVNYAMHGEKEVEEQLRQYCIQKEQNEKYISYLECFLKDGESETCLTSEEIDEGMLGTCFLDSDAEYGIYDSLNDKSTWTSGRFPSFAIYEEDCSEYDIAGSPNLVINGTKVSVMRSQSAILDTICSTFIEQPEECNTRLLDTSESPGFGYTNENPTATDATCG